LGWPVADGLLHAVSWHSKKEVGVDWIDRNGNRVRNGFWRLAGARDTRLLPTESGLALQTDEQTVWWLGEQQEPSWHVRAKPYVYRVLCSPGSDVFVGTDGRGGRLFAYDPDSGTETLNIRPQMGGAGTLTKVPGHEVLVAKFWVPSRDSTAGRLFMLSMRDRRHEVGEDCRQLLGVWDQGAVCLSGKKGDRVAIVDVRAFAVD
jgi:hypothetical protein